MVAGVESAVPADQVPPLRVNSVTAPVPLSPPPGSPTRISFPLAEMATELPNSYAALYGGRHRQCGPR